ncbi:methionine aminopeptidase 1D, mitochondrial [Coccinella septempunctata]|uniref:methionine aminopeptidase 1D, mitochondrial n=1 Tax=Coccinella septempunctata TaxID=41139 RepID=UPI001D077FD3|nr:methionine aminopeptidase 1D, mitochondrial [Coccinella septempunctata]
MPSRSFLVNSVKYFCNESIKFGRYNLVKPGNVSRSLSIPECIPKPSYYLTGVPSETLNSIDIKDHKQILQMKKACRLAANILKSVSQHIKIGQTTDEIDKFVHKLTIENKAYPSPYNYKHFPKSVCTSVNNVACHGIPDDRPLEDGDIINVDITVFFEGYHGDCSKTFLVGDVDEIGINLVESTEECLNMAIDMCKPGRRFRDLGEFISRSACLMGYTVIPAFIGHGLGTYFHGPPDIYHIANDYPGVMEKGMTFTIEPVIGQGTEMVEILEDGWTAVTVDGSRTAQFEHTICITNDGAEILTLPD